MSHLNAGWTTDTDAAFPTAACFDGLGSPAGRWACDPLAPDAPDDEVVVTTSRRLLRLAVAAADTGVRFTRDRLPHDPAAWMIAPRALFDGRAAMDAVQELGSFHRSVVLHGLGMDLDAAPEDIDSLLAEDDANDEPSIDGDHDADDGGSDGEAEVRLSRPRLLTCWVDAPRRPGRLFAFCAVVTDRPADLAERVVGRYGAEAASQARFAVGFDQTAPLATAMISDAMADTLALASADPESPLAQGLDVIVEQRFAA